MRTLNNLTRALELKKEYEDLCNKTLTLEIAQDIVIILNKNNHNHKQNRMVKIAKEYHQIYKEHQDARIQEA